MQPQAKPAPDWDLTAFFSAPTGRDYRDFVEQLAADLDRLDAALEALPPPAGADPAWVEALLALEDAGARGSHARTYLDCLTAADAADDDAARETARLARLAAAMRKVQARAQAALAAAGDTAFEALAEHPRLADAAHPLVRSRDVGRRAMAIPLEALAADLGVDGIAAWGRLYDRVSGRLKMTVATPGQPPRELPVAMTRSLLEDADPDVRAAAASAAALAWEGVADTVAACINGIAGTSLTLLARRGGQHFLEPALFEAGIERATLDAMLGAVRERQELARRYLVRKAGLLGRRRLGFEDLLAPLEGTGGRRVPWEEGTRKVRAAFESFHPDLGRYADLALERRWVDHAPRADKRPGAFCASSTVIGESRIFMTYDGAPGDVQTLAHELGHGYHAHVMCDMRPAARDYPMTLAETASIFSERLVSDAVLADPASTEAERLAVLDGRMQEAQAFLLNIPTRFDFEHDLLERRQGGELTARELCDLMLDAQRRNYGEALDPERLDPWFWASKPHFFITELSFYNFPYTFGYLFSLGLHARARAEGGDFLSRYVAILRRSGSAPVEVVAAEGLRADLRRPDFWHASLDQVAADLDGFEAATRNLAPGPA